jgi:carbon storage regulator
MLVLSRRRNESIQIGDDVKVTILDVQGDKVRLGIEAPPHVSVHREEVAESIAQEKQLKAKSNPEVSNPPPAP